MNAVWFWFINILLVLMDSNYIYTVTVTESIVSKYNQTNINDMV